MKTIKYYIITGIVVLLSLGCDKDFVEVNTNPYVVVEVDPALLFAGAQRSHLGNWTAEHTIVQQFVNPYNQGATLGFNFNADIDGVNNPKWDQSYPNVVRSMTQAIALLGEDTDRVNLLSMIRIWKAQVFMGLVDSYGDVPYFNAGRGLEFIFYPEYDDDEAIYADLYIEITASLAALDASADYVPEDLFYGKNSKKPTLNATDQVAKWKKLGNSLLLRLGMRYTEVDAVLAEEIVSEAFAGGVMTSNDDNAYVKYDGILYVHTENFNLRNFPQFNYSAEPFLNQLKNTNDPRAKYMFATYNDPGAVSNDLEPDTVLANQFGVPIGVDNGALADAAGAYRGSKGAGLNYSQINIYSVAAPNAPDFYVTYAQTSLLLAEAAFRGWITGSAQTYYENGITADMERYTEYPKTTAITSTEISTYLASLDVAYNAGTALELINTQYWIVNFRNGTEAFANFRRSGFPVLSPNMYNNNLQGGFARRLSYPDYEGSSNSASYAAAVTAIGGDNLTTRVFWDN